MKKHVFTLLVLLSLLSCNAYCQSVSASLYNSLTAQTSGLLKEKIFVHTDKNFYVAGEMMWFKIYCVNAASHRLLNLSKVAYIELLDSAHQPAAQAKILLQNGTGDGSFFLPFSIASGNYTLSAYTSWMKNENADDFFEKNITVINVQKLTVESNNRKKETASASFFPEGGNLITGIKTRVGCKVVNQYGKSIGFRGVLFAGADSLLSFTNSASGIGSLSFTPVKNGVYTAHIQTDNGLHFIQTLPAADENGFAMKLDDIHNGSTNIHIETNGVPAQLIYLVIHKNNKAILAKEAALQNNESNFTIDTASLPNGVSVFTVFNGQKQPVCERLFYKKYPQPLALHISSEAAVYDIRKKVNLTFFANETDTANGDSASLSLSVYRIDSLQAIDENTIDSYLNLSSEMNTPVDHPQAFLSQQNKNNDAVTDELMLVNGWRKFNTGAASSDQPSLLSFAPEYKGHIITGQITNNVSHLPEPNINAYLSLPGKGKQFYNAVSDSNGNLHWETENWYGDARLIAQADDKESAYSIRINNPFSRVYAMASPPAFRLPDAQPNTLLQHSIAMQTANIFSADKLNQFAVSVTDSTPFFISSDKTYKLDDYSRFTTMEEVLREYVALVNVTKKKGDYHFQAYDLSGEKMFTDDPLVLVDGIPFFNLDSFIALDPLKLKKLEVVNRQYFYGNAVFYGILSWQTYTGDAAGIDIDPKAVMIDYEGLQEKRIFYSPQYETEDQMNSHLPDFRTTLYWNPTIHLQGAKKEQLAFYTSDLPGKYVVVAQGAGSQGLYNATATFEVIKK